MADEKPIRLVIDSRKLDPLSDTQARQMAVAIGRFVATYCNDFSTSPADMVKLMRLIPHALQYALRGDAEGRKQTGIESEGVSIREADGRTDDGSLHEHHKSVGAPHATPEAQPVRQAAGSARRRGGVKKKRGDG